MDEFRPSDKDHEILKDRFEEPQGTTKSELEAEKEKLEDLKNADLLGDKTDMSMVKTYSSRGTVFPYREHELDAQLGRKISKIETLLQRIQEEVKVDNGSKKEEPVKDTVTTASGGTRFSRNVVRSAEQYLKQLSTGNRRKKRTRTNRKKSKAAESGKKIVSESTVPNTD